MKLRRVLTVSAILLGICAFIIRANGYELYIVALVGLTTIVGVGLNVLLGMTGQISLGHAAFYAIGAYVVAILTTKLDWTFWAALPLAGVVAGVAGVLLRALSRHGHDRVRFRGRARYGRVGGLDRRMEWTFGHCAAESVWL